VAGYVIETEKCLVDNECVNVCPVDAIIAAEDGSLSVTEDCIECAACEPVCETYAIHPAED
jgi:Fe-S-cluster-containing hydrogenase component 2